jgi:hypothetical protein
MSDSPEISINYTSSGRLGCTINDVPQSSIPSHFYGPVIVTVLEDGQPRTSVILFQPSSRFNVRNKVIENLRNGQWVDGDRREALNFCVDKHNQLMPSCECKRN